MNDRQRAFYAIDQAFTKITRYLSYVSTVCLIIMALLATTNVVTSKLFKVAIPSAVDWGTYLLIPVVFFAICYNLLTNGLIQVDFLIRHFPKAVNQMIEIISNLVGFGISAVITWRQTALAWRYFNSGKLSSFMPLHFPLWPFCVIIGLGAAIMGIIFLWRTVRTIFEKDFAVISEYRDMEADQ